MPSPIVTPVFLVNWLPVPRSPTAHCPPAQAWAQSRRSACEHGLEREEGRERMGPEVGRGKRGGREKGRQGEKTQDGEAQGGDLSS